MATQQYANLAQSTLSSGYTAGDTTLHLTSGASFPANGNFLVAMDDPPAFFLLCTARSSNDLTVSSSGQEGTSAANLASGKKVTQVITAGAFDAIRNEITYVDTYANLPSTTRQTRGNRFKASDSEYDFIFDGSNWQAFWRGLPVTVPPSIGGLTWVNQGSATADQTTGKLVITVPGSSASHHCLVKSMPARPYTFDVGVQHLGSFATISESGIVVRDSAAGKLVVFVKFWSANTLRLALSNWNSPTSFNAAVQEWAGVDWPLFLRLVDDNTNFNFYYSHDKLSWVLFKQVGRTAFLAAPDQVGIDTESESADCVGTFFHWSGI